MHNTEIKSLPPRAANELQQATGIRRRNDLRSGLLDMLQLSYEELIGHFRLDQVIDAGAAAAPRAFLQLDQFEIGNGAQKFPGLYGDLLAVAKVTGFVVGR